MGIWHLDPACESALTNLNDEISIFERTTGRNYVLILVPEAPDEKIHMSQNGKPLPEESNMDPKEFLAIALQKRRHNLGLS
ncbi:MAG: hypothetical protein WCT08_06015 [Patescibacteria group bacterium]|jgi:hypothetical protein